MIDAQRLRDLAVYYFITYRLSSPEVDQVKDFVKFVIDYQNKATEHSDAKMSKTIAQYIADEMNKSNPTDKLL